MRVKGAVRTALDALGGRFLMAGRRAGRGGARPDSESRGDGRRGGTGTPAKGRPGGGAGGRGGGKRGDGRKRKAAPKSRRRTWGWRLARWTLVAGIWGFVIALGVLAWFAYDLPRVDDVEAMTRQPSVTVVAADGSRLASFGDVYGAVVTVDDVPPYLPQAILATEDRRFYEHFGLDVFGLARAMVANLRAGHVVQGGSTITQQVAKNLFLTHERTIKRKVQEVLLALWLEQNFTKDEILTIYMNRVYLGAGVHGMEAAAQRYFDVSARRVSLWQAAVLAGLMKAPSRYNPAANPDLAAKRAREVLGNLVEAGYLTAGQAERAAEGLQVAGLDRARPGRYFADWVMDDLEAYIGRVQQDLTVVTTLDPGIQRAAEDALSAALAREGKLQSVGQGAVVVLDTDGAVRAMVGGRSYAASQFNRATQAMRQPGSAFKPFVFAAAVEDGMGPATVMADEPVTVDGWSPRNFDGRYLGAITLTDAMARSVNTVAVKAAQDVGVDAVTRTARRFGVTTPIADNLSIALGTSETTLLDLTGAYVPFANGGWGVVPHGIVEIRTRDGRVLYRRSGGGTGRVAPPEVVSAMNTMMSAVVSDGTGSAADLPGRPEAGKTGTSQDSRDAWFVGYTAHYVTGVWMGNDDGTPTAGVTGGGLPAKVWQRVMTAAEQGLPARALP
ncbi:Multimodular transpeptidase-transglycosylase [Caenispirillum salinarum AK4]|uniref:Multimodular transpeptidase-transglycosylase n=1 Tax=Caenispirillum salinarum AK4 TaxID=1238182 RepID=K9H4N5_9PROT|nr:penicillin-binding protein 1A [Caenispirillum salinarum]EKV32044.1 Multimodular transpeptidase-transglycosylase [Caenispirillum salinarum AK4]